MRRSKRLLLTLVLALVALVLLPPEEGMAARRAKKKAVTPPADLRTRAASEITPPAKMVRPVSGPSGSPATVLTYSVEPDNPLTYDGLQLGLSLTPYQPRGEGRVIGLDPFQLKNLGTQPMLGVEMRWLPWVLTEYGEPQVGFFTSVGYAQHRIHLRGPSGYSFGDTKLHSILSMVGPAAEWVLPQAPEWSFAAEMGFGRLDVMQASVNRLANTSSSLWLAVPGVSALRRWQDWWITGSYQRAVTIGAPHGGARAQENLFSLGFTYAIR